MLDTRAELGGIRDAVRERFDAQKRVLSFQDYLELVVQHPYRYTRDAPRYVRDCWDFFGTTEKVQPTGTVRRWNLFDLKFAESSGIEGGRDALIGQESVQEAVYRALENFANEGRVNRLMLMHGPNGSAKTTFVACVMRALEHYSGQDDGALYRFSWIFPRGRDGKSSIGFGTDASESSSGSYAHLPEERIEVKLSSALREHPLLLLPRVDRRRFLTRAYELGNVAQRPPDWLWAGELGQKNQQIFEALLTAYRGDIERVLAHVQVERYTISKRYRVGVVTIGPQMVVDAKERQITADHTLHALPASLSSLTLFEPTGELVDASGGLVEYSDLLKRPLDAWKYLLLAIETGEVSLQLSNLALNEVLLASSNELHLAAFREHHEYNSFRARIQFVRVPYLLDYRAEQRIYDEQVVSQVERHVAPHATYVAACWAVLTRMRRARADRYESSAVGRIAADLSPLEKAELYADGVIPTRLSSDDDKELRSGIEQVFEEWELKVDYEGMSGVSPREVRDLLLEAAHEPDFECLSVLAVLERIDAFCQRGDHPFLKQAPDRGYHDHREFVLQVRERWLDRTDDELRTASGAVDELQYVGLFEEYVTHLSFWMKKEQVYNRVTGAYEDPDGQLMSRVEKMLGVEDGGADAFRNDIINVLAGQAIDHPGASLDYTRLFPRYIERIKDAYFAEHGKQMSTLAADLLALLDDSVSGLEATRLEQATRTRDGLMQRFGYQASSIRDAVGALVQDRYSGVPPD